MRSTQEVFDDHLRLRVAGEVDEDLARNYAPEVRGAARLADSEARFEFPTRRVEGEYALLVWNAQSPNGDVHHGVDSFVIRQGKIVMQSIYYRVQEAKDRGR